LRAGRGRVGARRAAPPRGAKASRGCAGRRVASRPSVVSRAPFAGAPLGDPSFESPFQGEPKSTTPVQYLAVYLFRRGRVFCPAPAGRGVPARPSIRISGHLCARPPEGDAKYDTSVWSRRKAIVYIVYVGSSRGWAREHMVFSEGFLRVVLGHFRGRMRNPRPAQFMSLRMGVR
jgi:hypothetical protein